MPQADYQVISFDGTEHESYLFMILDLLIAGDIEE